MSVMWVELLTSFWVFSPQMRYMFLHLGLYSSGPYLISFSRSAFIVARKLTLRSLVHTKYLHSAPTAHAFLFSPLSQPTRFSCTHDGDTSG